MPIILDDLAKNFQTQPKTNTPTYFSKLLTGSGKSTGLLNEKLVPERTPTKQAPISARSSHTTVTVGTSECELIPMDFPTMNFKGVIHKLPGDAVNVDGKGRTGDDGVHILVLMKNAVIATDSTTGDKKKREIFPEYNVVLLKQDSQNSDNFEFHLTETSYLHATVMAGNPLMAECDVKSVEAHFDDLNVYDIACQTVAAWQEGLPDVAQAIVENYNSDLTRKQAMTSFAKSLNLYRVGLEDYKKIYDIILNNMPDDMKSIVRQNLNLHLNMSLSELEQNKSSIMTFTGKPWANPPGNPKLSVEQMNVVTTTEPCIIVQAGAGTGKSHSIHNRLQYMKDCGVNLSEVMVLSFTNAAADHIKSLAPNVNSKTIASMIHDIYSANYDHQLSTIDTMLNILYARKDLTGAMAQKNIKETATKLISGLKMLKKNINEGLAAINTLVEDHFNDVINVLDEIGQTTLELESIICYNAGDVLVEPDANVRHLIMDEVQDNSIFEFIYIIQYIIRHKATIYLVGDCSQTLYEFRASNPKALNCLEMSGIFNCMQLQTNYRSNQNILDFANVLLSTIEANKFAKIQLRANSFITGNFKDDVHVRYERISNRSDALPPVIRVMLNDAKKWIDEKLKNKEQVCFLAFKRKDLKMFESFVADRYPNNTIINIVPAKTVPCTFFSKYINVLGENYRHIVGKNATVEIMRHMVDNIGLLVYDNQHELLKAYIGEWANAYDKDLIAFDAMLQGKQITKEEFKQHAFQTLIDFEINKNAMKQKLTSMENEKLKNSDISQFDFVCSTIHSAKGLEFDNVILLYDEVLRDNEESKRMYYVGLTRAKNSEWVISIGRNINSHILTLYDDMCKQAMSPGSTTVTDDKADDGIEPQIAVTVTERGKNVAGHTDGADTDEGEEECEDETA